MCNTIRKRSINLDGYHTSVSLEQEFWDALSSIARGRGTSANALVREIDGRRRGAAGPQCPSGQMANLSSACRLYVLADLQHAVTNNRN